MTDKQPRTPNLTRDLFFPPPANVARLADFDWQAHGVTRKFLLLMVARSGSTLLSRLMEERATICPLWEYFNVETPHAADLHRMPVKTPRRYLAHLCQSRAVSGAFGAKVDSGRFQNLDEVLDVSRIFAPGDTRYIWLTRRDVVAQAFSNLTASRTGIWHRERGHIPESAPQADVSLSDDAIWRQILLILGEEAWAEAHMLSHQINPLRLTYEDLVAAPALVAARALDFIGAAPKALSGHDEGLPMQRVQTERTQHAITEFHLKYADLLRPIFQDRRCVDIARIYYECRQRDLDVGFRPIWQTSYETIKTHRKAVE